MPEVSGVRDAVRAAHRAAVIGSPVDHSLSPRLHRAAYRALGLTDWEYGRHAVGGPGEPTVAEFVAGLDAAWVGLSATMPCKEPLLAVADEATPRAELVGSANTLVRRGDGWLADNTDAVGLVGALAELAVPAGPVAVLVGAGATARSALVALSERGCTTVQVAVRGQVREPTAALATRLGIRLEPIDLADLAAAAGAVPLTVVTVPGGTDIGVPPPPAGSLTGRVVLDVGYGGWPTPAARWAAAGGARVVSGLPMLVHQAGEQVRLMTGREAPVDAMYAAIADVPGMP